MEDMEGLAVHKVALINAFANRAFCMASLFFKSEESVKKLVVVTK